MRLSESCLKSSNALVAVCCLLPLLSASPVRLAPGGHDSLQDSSRDQNYRRHTSEHRTVRSEDKEVHVVHFEVGVAYPCTKVSDCYPKPYKDSSIPSKFINCTDSVCVCSDCFVSVNDSCVVDTCHRYDNDSMKCVDERRSQKDAFLLSFFLSGFGAANFYIEQYGLGGAQLGLFIALIFSFCSICCLIKCCNCYEEDVCEDLCYDCCDCCEDCCCDCCFVCVRCGALLYIALSCMGIVLCLLAIPTWWAADMAVFIENSRDAGDGCALKFDL